MWICNKCETYNEDSSLICYVCNTKRTVVPLKKDNELNKEDSNIKSGNYTEKTSSDTDNVRKTIINTSLPPVYDVKTDKIEKKSVYVSKIDYPVNYVEIKRKQRKARRILIAVNLLIAVGNVLGIIFLC